MKYVDIVLVKDQVANGKLAIKLDMFNNILLEDCIAGEAVTIGKLSECCSFHPKGKWTREYIVTSHNIHQPMRGEERWVCSECGWSADEAYDWCTCGADMRDENKRRIKLRAEREALLEQL